MPFKMNSHNTKSLKKSNSVCAPQRFKLGGLHCIPITIVFTLVERDLKVELQYTRVSCGTM